MTFSPVRTWSPSPAVQPQPLRTPPRTDSPPQPALLVAAPDGDLFRYDLPAYRRIVAKANTEISALLERERPRVLALDADLPGLDVIAACQAAQRHRDVSVLVVTGDTATVPALLKAGCHAVLIKPVAPSLLAGRIGRMLRMQDARADGHADGAWFSHGTNRAWQDISCPKCVAAHAVSFDFASHRRMWFACLACEHVWIGARQE